MHWAYAMTGAIPALVVMWFVDRYDAKRPEPRWSLRKVSIAGAVAVLPCIAIETFLLGWSPPPSSYGYPLYHGFVVAAAVEELAKVMCVYWLVWHSAEFDERLDGIVYATRAGLGFALVENVSYLAHTASASEFLVLWILRAMLAVPGHAIWAGVMGYLAAKRRFDGRGVGLVGGYLLAVALHGGYDAAIFMGIPLRLRGHDTIAGLLLGVAVLSIFGGFALLRAMARRALEDDDAAAARRALDPG